MMNRLKIYHLIGRILALDHPQADKERVIQELQKLNFSWEKFINIADKHLVLQVLYPKILAHKLEDFFPAEVLEHLKYIFELSVKRNDSIMNQAESLSKLLSSAGITPLYLKGMGNILDGLYKNKGERILHDIDILIPRQKIYEAVNLLVKDGYQSNTKLKSEIRDSDHHFPILYKRGEPVYVEIHWQAVNNRYERILANDEIFRHSKVPAGFSDCLVMSDEHKIIHNFLHAQMDHRARIFAREYMRNLYDVLLLSDRKNPEDVLAGLTRYHRISSSYLDIYYDTFGIVPERRIVPGLFLHTYRFRYRLNIRSKIFGRLSLLIIRMFLGYILTPIKAIGDKELRKLMIRKIQNPEWYRKQWNYYSRVLGIGGRSARKD
ncbi:MAG: nucleotidyltransferase family protein [Bacteroidales bacterium]|nr:nucleotidyltransferase family protein [Bacteroidales bacterium]MCB8999831.1 nucleotidyltransferase family protein [Bacteroidales bacterium]MCB9012659.1 nucleotidyltransferase family protein [Bacteroidales bacterium]